MNKTRKAFRLSEDCLRVIDRVMTERGGTRTDALEYIIRRYETSMVEMPGDSRWVQEFADFLLSKYDEKYKGLHTRIRMGLRTAEFNSEMILNAVNMILFHFGIKDPRLLTQVKMPVIERSEKAIKDRLEHFKQRREDRRRNHE